MMVFAEEDLKLLKKALGKAKTLSSKGDIKVKKTWKSASVKLESEYATTREKVFAEIDNNKGVGWVETTDAIFIRRKENGKWLNISKFLGEEKQEEFDKFPNKFAVLSAELAQDKKSIHINHIDGDKWQIDTIIDGEGSEYLAQKVSYLGLGKDDYEIVYRVYWELNKEGLPKQKCARFVGFCPTDGGKND